MQFPFLMGLLLTMVIGILFILNADSKIFKQHRFIVKTQSPSYSNLSILQFSREPLLPTYGISFLF